MAPMLKPTRACTAARRKRQCPRLEPERRYFSGHGQPNPEKGKPLKAVVRLMVHILQTNRLGPNRGHSPPSRSCCLLWGGQGVTNATHSETSSISPVWRLDNVNLHKYCPNADRECRKVSRASMWERWIWRRRARALPLSVSRRMRIMRLSARSASQAIQFQAITYSCAALRCARESQREGN